MIDYTEDLLGLTLEELVIRFPENGADIHRALKTGLVSSTKVLLTLEPSPQLDLVNKNKNLFNDEVNVSSFKSNKRISRSSTDHTSELDCWGRIPEKDMITICSNCNKQISATRFSLHAEKCLKIRDHR